MNPQQNTIFGSKETKKLSEKLIPGLKKGKQKKEERIQMAFCKFVKKQYPDIIFSCDLASGLHLPQHIGKMHKQMRSSRAQCDFSSPEPMHGYYGFFLELKKDRDEVYKKDGGFKKQTKKIKNSRGIVIEEYDHIEEQWNMIQKLRSKGYWADFGLGLQDSIDKFREYMKK